MRKIMIVTDSTADLSAALAERLNITVVPLTVVIDGKTYLDRVDISNADFYEHLRTAKTLPTTSQPTPGDFLEAYRSCQAQGADAIISLHLASDLSGTYNSACMAASMIEEELPVCVYDSKTATMGMALQLMSLAEKIKTTDDLYALDAFIKAMVADTSIYFILDTLDNLEKGGRIGRASYLVGSLLNIKPLLFLEDGVIRAYDKIRTNKQTKAIRHCADVVIEHIDPARPVHLILGYNDNRSYAEYLYEELNEHMRIGRVEYVEIGSVVSTHIGLGAVGAGFYQL